MIEAERDPDRLFDAHLEMKRLLTAHQVHEYGRLRGYGQKAHTGH